MTHSIEELAYKDIQNALDEIKTHVDELITEEIEDYLLTKEGTI